MLGFFNSIKTTAYNSLSSSYTMLFSSPQNTQKTKGEDKATSGLDYSQQTASFVYIAINNAWQKVFGHADDTVSSGSEDEDPRTSVFKELESKIASLEQQLYSKSDDFESLEQEYNKQRKQRLRDKVLVDQAFEEVLKMETQCKEVQDAHNIAEELLKIEIKGKDKQLAKITDEYHSALETAKKSYAADLKSLSQKVAQEQRQMEAAHIKTVHDLVEASKTNRSAWKKAKQSMKADMKRMDCEFKDGLQASKDEISRITELSYHLAAENRLLAGTIDEIPVEELREHTKEVFQEVRHAREELEQTHIKLKIANEKIENILEAMQQQRDHYEAHGAQEQEAQAQVYDIHQEIIQLQEKLKFRDNLLHAANISGNGKTLTTVDADAISKIAFENDELQANLCTAQEENSKLRAKFNKVDDENCSISMKLDIAEADLHKAQERIKMLDEKQRLINKEHKLLFMAIEDNQALTAEDKELLQKHLQEASASNDHLRNRNHDLKHELSELKSFADVVEDKCNTKVEKAYKMADFWEEMYWDEAVPKVERLTQEIHELNKELGRENVHVQERLERNVVVADRNALRYACENKVQGVDPEIILAEYYEPGFVPGWIPATHDALRTLRPLGWAPVAELGKVWLAPMYKPFTQEDVEYRLRAKHQIERKEHRANMNASPLPEADHETPLEASNSSSQSSQNAHQTSQTTYREPQAPAYNSEWMKKRSELTREVYEGMDTDLKLSVLRMLHIEVEEQGNFEDQMF